MGSKDDSEEGTRVYVGGLNESIKKEDLEVEFEKFGKLSSVWVAFNPPGFAFIEFINQMDAEAACDNLNGSDLMGAKLRVEIARGRRRGGFRGGSGGGGGGGGRRFESDRGSSGGGWRRGGSSSSSSFGGDRSFRGSSRGSPRFDSYGGRRRGSGGRGGGSFNRDFDRDRYGDDRNGYSSSRGSGGYRGGGGGGDRYRSRSPAQRDSY